MMKTVLLNYVSAPNCEVVIAVHSNDSLYNCTMYNCTTVNNEIIQNYKNKTFEYSFIRKYK